MIVRYLAGTIEKGIIIPPFKGDLTLRCYVDADFAGLYKIDSSESDSSAKSRTGYIIFLGPWPLIWKSFMQKKTAMSTLEAEYSALSSATRSVLFVIQLLKPTLDIVDNSDELKSIVQAPCIIYEDNNGAYTVAKNQRVTSRTKYFNVEWHHFWEQVNDGTLSIEKIATGDQLADYLTKGLTRELFVNNRKSVQGW